MLQRLVPDRFVLILLATIALASVLPVAGRAAEIAGLISMIAIFILFFLHGLRLPRAEVVTAIRNWRLQAAIFAFVFGAMPLAAIALSYPASALLPVGLVTGLLFLGLLPSTVQSAISYASIAGGNVAASLMAAALLNLTGIVISPLLLVLVIGGAGEHAIGVDAVGRIVTILLLPFALGQAVQHWLAGWALRQKRLLSFMDRAAIAIAVYVAFSAAVAGGLWETIDWPIMAALLVLLALLLAFAFVASWGLGGLLGLARPDRISLMFAGAHKSIATGAPLAAILFTGPKAGMIILPAILYHQLQLIVSAPLAARLAKGHEEPARAA